MGCIGPCPNLDIGGGGQESRWGEGNCLRRGSQRALRSKEPRGNPTFINLDKPYPNQIFTVLIWGSDRPKFGDPEETYRSKRICVTGKISDYKGVPEIVAYEPSQIKVQAARE
jgi:hypothetical protein